MGDDIDDEANDDIEEATDEGAGPEQAGPAQLDPDQLGPWIGPWKRRMWLQPLDTDPALRHMLRTPLDGVRLCEATLYRGRSVDTRGWIVRLHTGALVFTAGRGSIRTVDADAVMRAMAAMEGAEVKRAQRGHARIDGTHLRQALEQRGYSQSSFAREWGVSDRNVRRWCADELDIPLWVGKVLQLMETYDIPPLE